MEELEVFFWRGIYKWRISYRVRAPTEGKGQLLVVNLPSGSSSFSSFKDVKKAPDRYLSAIHFFIHYCDREVNIIIKKCGVCFEIGIISLSQSRRFNQRVLKHVFSIISTFKIIIITIIIIVIIIYNPDVDQCQSDALNECKPNALCTNTEGSYICRCLRGFEGDGRQCIGKAVFSFHFSLVTCAYN